MTFKVGDIIQSIQFPDRTYEVISIEETGRLIFTKKLTGSGYMAIGRRVNLWRKNFHLYSLIQSNGVESIALTLNASKCDCGGHKTYHGEASHYHSNWCFLNQQKLTK